MHHPTIIRQHSLTVCLLLAATLLLAACDSGNKHRRTINPNVVGFTADYNPMFDNQLYPSFIMGLNTYNGSDDLALFTVSLTSPSNNSVLRVVVDSSSLNYVTILQETLPKKGERYTFKPNIKWKYDKLYATRQSGVIDLTFTCFVNDEEVDIKNLRLHYRSVNECPLSLRDTANRPQDFRWLFAAYVNEDHPYIEKILTETLDKQIVTQFSGYQSGAKQVEQQVFAIWYYALSHGISYSSISCTSNPSTRSNVQHIRFFDEVYNTRQANCIDACVFFASILRKIGLKPVIFVEPCHAYLGYYTDKNRKNLKLLETTITGWVNIPEMQKSFDATGKITNTQFDNVSKYLTAEQQQKYRGTPLNFEALKMDLAKALFEKATTYNADTYNANKAAFSDTTKITYQQLDIELLRKMVQPIN